MGCKIDTRRVVHCIKVGIALVLVSLLYMVNPMFKQVGENAMWAIMTVVVMFEFYAGATLGKGINRGIGTLMGGGLGCLAAIVADEIGGIGKLIIIASSLFVFGAGATYCRLVPRIKKRYDYGFMIFILTFNLVAVSGVRAEKVLELARDRLATIGMGFALCVFVSLLICPIWASNELHYSTASKFDKLATRCLDEYFKMASEKENQVADDSAYIQACKSVLNSKSTDETLANNAKWEPWHGKFGLYYPWEKYLEVGEHLRELAATILSLKGCLQSPKQPSPIQRQTLKEPCENFMLSIQWILKELGEGIEKMELCQTKALTNPKLQSMKLQLTPRFSSCKMEVVETDENLAITTFNFLLLEIVEKVEILAKKVEELGEAANFRDRKIDV
ncbi:hypothetical protein Pfo_006286 [Paulownia fortunei]|nr:hypothetical protein Pfo_006286 [Paulownia fortunei]